MRGSTGINLGNDSFQHLIVVNLPVDVTADMSARAELSREPVTERN